MKNFKLIIMLIFLSLIFVGCSLNNNETYGIVSFNIKNVD